MGVLGGDIYLILETGSCSGAVQKLSSGATWELFGVLCNGSDLKGRWELVKKGLLVTGCTRAFVFELSYDNKLGRRYEGINM
jgi:hypothetical protein